MRDVGDVNAAVGAGMLVGEPKMLPGGGMYAVYPVDAHFRDLEDLLVTPTYATGTMKARTVKALTEYINRHAVAYSHIFADVLAPSITCVIDYHDPQGLPHHKAHRAVYQPPYDLAWQAWAGVSGKMLAQDVFARFIEENRINIVEPAGADVLELVSTLEAHKKVSFRSGVRLNDGTQSLAYAEETESANGGKTGGALVIPAEITLGMPVFYGGDAYKIVAFFRYRIAEGKLTMGVELHRKLDVVNSAFLDIVEKVRAACPAVPLFEGEVA